jgi:transposase
MSKSDKHEKFIELRASNESYTNIAKKLDVSKTTLLNWAKQYENEIQNQQGLYLDALQEQYKIGKQHRIKVLGKRLEKLLEEAEKRDLKDVSTSKLYEMIDKTMQALAREEMPLVYTEIQNSFDLEPLKSKKTFNI